MVNPASAGDGPRPGPLVYLDHAATTPMLPEAVAAMAEELVHTGNPSSLHNGRRARRVVEESREQIAQAFGARPSEVVFTSGGTEADNLAVKGMYWARQSESGLRRRRVLATAIEHHAVLDSVEWLGEHEGAQVDWLPVDSAGLLSPEVLRAAIDRDPSSVALVSVMWANNEVGAIQPVAGLAAVAAEYGIPFHSDAVQAAGQLRVSLAASGATALTITGHKIGGPVGPARCCSPGAAMIQSPCCTVAGRSATSGRAPSTPPRSGLSRSRSRWPRPTGTRTRPGSARCAIA